ncbi:hypothetical protein SO802_034362 [Lithocarpus litseifolius]|uniref:TIR domain-containing protein n=1 Tax=Lithocarpus litseifolius TaxID=425828 RepID=A0AAW2BGG1_9ROSI
MKRALDFTEGSEELPPAKVLCQRDLYCDSMDSSSSCFPSSSSISSTSQWKYDVFLSFRGEDTRNTAVDFLNYALERRGIYIFKDDEKLEGGKTIKPELLKAIEESRFAVVILSENYASSTWCLEELVKIIECKEEKGMTVLPIFYNVDPSNLRKLEGAFAKAFVEHEKQFKEKVSKWRDALNHVAGIVGYHVKNSLLSEVVNSIVRLVSRKSSFEFSEITEGLVGIHTRLVELESCLALWLKDDVRSIGFWAMGGMGKSTLAKVAYKMISNEFDVCCFIDDVRKKDLCSLQKNLISQISKETNLNIQNKLDGERMIKKMLQHKKVLLVLDDVDESNELKMLVRKWDWFGSGSRIIITTRDKHLLEDLPVDEIFEVKALNYKEAFCLFCSKAFKKELCPDEYLNLSNSFVRYVNGLPLALEVLGSFLFKSSTAEWKSALEMLKEDPNSKINQVLKISFDGLPDSVKDIFKDIACLFNHEKKDHVVRILDSIGHRSVIGLRILIDKSLLKIFKNNELWMHNLIENMGRNMVRQESLEPGERSRLWLYKDIDHVLKNNTVRSYILELIPYLLIQQKGLLWNPNAFLKMPNLKFLRIRNIFLQLDTLPNSLRYFEYNDYPSKSLPPLPDELVELHLLHSKIEVLWEGMKNFDKLKSIHMAGSSDMIIAPNFNGVPNLEELDLEGCSKLRELHPSIGKLKNLKLLNLTKCQELTTLPNKFELESLVTLNLTRCSKVKKIPEFVGNMKHLQELLLAGTAITELPSSVECLIGLNILILQDCNKLVCLPNTICNLTSLKNLDLWGCSKFDKLPDYLGNIVCLKELDLCGTAIRELPSSVEFLIGLTSLNLKDCKNFVLLPSTICSLKSLKYFNLIGCSKFDKLPEDLGNIVPLEVLLLKETAIKELPSSVEFLISLKILNLDDCKNFVLLPSTVCGLKSLIHMALSGCSKFVNLPENFGNLKRLNALYLEGTAIEVLPSSVGRLAALADLGLKDCKNLVRLPSTICNLKMVFRLNLTGCSKITNLPENLEYMESLSDLRLGGTAIKELPSSIIHLKRIPRLSFNSWRSLSSSQPSLTRRHRIDLSDCNLSAIPSGIDRFSEAGFLELFLRGNDFVSLPESFSQFSGLTRLYLDGCKSLRSLSNIPSTVYFICVDNCTSLERLPEPSNDFYWSSFVNFTVQCFNCFKLAANIKDFSNVFEGQSSKQFEKCYIIPGREIPKWFEEVNICDTSVVSRNNTGETRTFKVKKVKIQLPGCDEWRGIVLCVVFLPERHHRHHPFLFSHQIRVNGLQTSSFSPRDHPETDPDYMSENGQYPETQPDFRSEYGKVESHHLWLHSVSKTHLRLPETPGCSIDKKGFHQVELEIETYGLEVEKIGHLGLWFMLKKFTKDTLPGSDVDFAL